MSRGDDNLDKIFQDAFISQEIPMNPAHWQDAQQLLNANKKAVIPFFRKPVFWISALLTLSISAMLFSDSTPEKLDLSTTSNSSSSMRMESISASILPTKTETQQTRTSENSATSVMSTGTENTLVTNQTEAPTVRLEAPANASNFSIKEISNTEVKIEKPTPSFRRNSTLNRTLNGSSSIATHTPSNSPSKKTSEFPNSPVNTDRENTIPTGMTMAAASTKANFKNSSANFATSVRKAAQNGFFREEGFVQEENVHPLTPRTLLGLEKSEYDLAYPNSKSSIHKKLGSPFNLRLSIGSMWANTKTEHQIQSKYQETDFEVSVEYQFKKRLGVQMGLQYVQSNAKQQYAYTETKDLSYWNEEQVITTIPNRVWWLGGWHYYSPTQDTSLIRTYINQTDTANNTLHINHQIIQIEVPILVTYNYGVKRFNIQLATGFSFRKALNANGSQFLSEDPYPGLINVSDHLNGIQTHFIFQSEVAYGLDDKWWLTCRPQMKINMNSLYKAPSTIRPKLGYYGANIGLMYKF